MSVHSEYMREYRKNNPPTPEQREANRKKCQRQRDAKAGIKPVEVQEFLPALKPDEPAQPIGRPDSGPRCACGNVLYFYEHGKCLHCSRQSIIAARTGKVLMTDAAQRSRVKRQAVAEVAA